MNREDTQLLERTQQIVRVLREVRDDGRNFSLSVWGEEIHEEDKCGTVACAIGWMGFNPWFRRRGFCMVVDDENEDQGQKMYLPRFSHQGGVYEGWDAVTRFFGIGEPQQNWLFIAAYYPEDYTIDTVIDRVNSHISENYGAEHVV